MLKKILEVTIMVTIIIGYCLTAHANEYCNYVSDLASDFMTSRQAGWSLEKSMEYNIPSKDNQYHDICVELTKAAYKVPVQRNENFKQAEIIKFRTNQFSKCLDNHSGQKTEKQSDILNKLMNLK